MAARPQDRAQEDHQDRQADRARRTLSERIAAGGWLLYTLELLVLVVIFGWLFMTVQLAG